MIITSPFPSLEISDLPLTEYVFEHADAHAERPALIDGASGAVTTHGELARSSRMSVVNCSSVHEVFGPLRPSTRGASLAEALARRYTVARLTAQTRHTRVRP